MSEETFKCCDADGCESAARTDTDAYNTWWWASLTFQEEGWDDPEEYLVDACSREHLLQAASEAMR